MIKLEFKTRGKIITRYEVFSNMLSGKVSYFCIEPILQTSDEAKGGQYQTVC